MYTSKPALQFLIRNTDMPNHKSLTSLQMQWFITRNYHSDSLSKFNHA